MDDRFRFAIACKSPVGTWTAVSDGAAIVQLMLRGQKRELPVSSRLTADEICRAAAAQIEEYFQGKRREFDLPLKPEGSAFDRRVWRALLEIPFGETWSYGQLAKHIGSPNAARAVGAANGRNPIGLVIPCHRVIGSSGKPVGYGGGLPAKSWLLEHESTTSGAEPVLRHKRARVQV